MRKRYFYFLHLYSCLRFSDLEILYSKLRKLGFELHSSNSWGDCFEIKSGAEREYKVIPIKMPSAGIHIEHWKLKARNSRYYVFEYDEKEEAVDILINSAEANYFDISQVIFLLAFPISVYYFIQKFALLEQSVFPVWISGLFMISVGMIYVGHLLALLISLTRRYFYSEERRKRSEGEFWGRVVISCIVNILQIILVLIIFWGLLIV